MPYDPSYHVLWRPDRVRAIVADERPDVLEIHSPYVAAMGALASRPRDFGVRTFFWHSDFIDTYRHVLLEREVLGRRLPGSAQRAVTEPLWGWVRRIGSRCAATIVAARWQVDKLRAHGVPRVVELPFGVDKATFHPRARDEALRATFGVLPGERMLVGVGRFAIEKRWDVALAAFREVRREVPSRLVLFGDGPERARLEALAGGGVVFAGFVKDREALADALSSADALVHSCPYETFGLSIAEAVCSGLPVVVPDEGGAFEQAAPSFAETYPSLDASALAAATIRLLRRDPASLRHAAVLASADVLTVQQHFERLVALYGQLLHEARA